MIKNIIITGEKQVGKSTLVKRFLAQKGLSYSGLLTLPLLIDKQKKGYYFYDISYIDEKEYQNKLPAIIRVNQNKMLPIEEIFETVGTKILKNNLQSPKDILVLDELGKSEKNCQRFLDMVEEYFTSQKKVIAVIQKNAKHYFDMVEKLPHTKIFTVTKANREDILKQMLLNI